MKQYLSALLLVCLFSTALPAQEKEGKSVTPPAAAKAAFQKKFPDASHAKWEKEGAGYEVNFAQDNKEYSAVFDSNGVWQETEEEISRSGLPAAAMVYINLHYKGSAIKETARITKANGDIVYEAQINKKDILFDSSGKFLKEEKD